MTSPDTTARTAAETVLAGLDDVRSSLHGLYRHLHAHPELSMQEHETARLIESHLAELGVATFRCGGTGVVGVLENGPGPVVAFRADTDALPIAEQTGLDYASSATGVLADGTETQVMHGCGHDTHTASLLISATLLARSRHAWSGTIVLIFQPGEEIAAGARAMVDDGLWDRAPRPDVVLGQHVGPEPARTVQYRTGTSASMADSWQVTMFGRGAHGSQPHLSVDPIVQVAHTITRIQTIAAREVDPMDSAVVTIGRIAGGMKENVIPDSTMFTVNVRTFDEQVRERVLDSLRRIITAEAAASGAPEPLITELSTFPRLVNDEATTTRVMTALGEFWGPDSVGEGQLLMGSEDFGVLGEAAGAPYCFWFIGGTDPELYAKAEAAGTIPSSVAGNHSPFFAPEIEPTLSRMVEAAVVGMVTFLHD
ncbi:hippurate hydrolase [Halopolyspora algeriensis]|uniref:Hippurate hydrolase n=1 Tax=Halopolyspora algeriensis TaxID=1500506 RepID=A0A368VWG8_9ACTN|nr:amidohydrolase [Halopolyspora algeriensis]RCW45710.1 hippurate hydrolase [Halopolyspora algeriensis]TQM54094.1 hippurate hydrolase [Halopolyspora algeriensis]